MTTERPEENSSAIDGAGEEADFHQASAGKSLSVALFCNLIKVGNKSVRFPRNETFLLDNFWSSIRSGNPTQK